MSEETTALIALSAAIAARDGAALDAAIDAAHQHARPERVEETLLQSYLFVGFPAALHAIGRWRERTGQKAPAVAQPLDAAHWAARGADVCALVYGGQYDRLRANIRALHPDMEQWMLVEGYGKVLGRPGLPLAVRELCICALLAVQDAQPQLFSHARGALNAGASEEDVTATLAIAMRFAAPTCAQRSAATWQAVRQRRAEME